MLEMQGAMGLPLGPFAWWEAERMFLGWRRQHASTAGLLLAGVGNFLGGDFLPEDFSPLLPRTPNRRRRGNHGDKRQVSFAEFRMATAGRYKKVSLKKKSPEHGTSLDD